MWTPGDLLDPRQPALYHRTVPTQRGIPKATGDPNLLLRGEKRVYPSQLGAARDNGSLPILGPHSKFQQQRLGGTVRKYEECAAAVGGGGNGADEYGTLAFDLLKSDR